ncbi:MAG: alpha-amylase family glycosyl hydrolase [Dictyoglomaceae bacterium]
MNPVDDGLYGNLTYEQYLLERKKGELKGINQWKIEPTDPLPNEEIRIYFSTDFNTSKDRLTLYYTKDGSEPKEEDEKITLCLDKILWEDSLWNFIRIYKGTIPGQKENTIIRYRVEDDEKIYSFSVDNFSPPNWIDETVIYHIFVDRFAKGKRPVFYQDNLKAKWGGNLKGIVEHLDYIESLGVNALWLSPIFKSPSYHGYDVIDYFEIDPVKGTKEDLKILVNKAFNKGIRIFLDFVPNHLSYLNPIFQEALKNPESRYRKWFTFKENGYESFAGVKSMPKIDLRCKEAREYIIESAKYWIKNFNISGYRLDHANGPVLDFWTEYWFKIKNEFPDTFHFAEVIETPEKVKNFEGKLDGALDFFLFKMTREFFIGKKWNIEEFSNLLISKRLYFNPNFKMISFLENHDSNRFLWVAKDKKILKLALIFQFTQNEIPIIYNGTEIGANQYRDMLENGRSLHEYVRLPMIWDEKKQDLELFSFCKKLVNIRKKHPSLYKGEYIPFISLVFSFWKVFDKEKILVLINQEENKKVINLPQGLVFKNLLDEKIYKDITSIPPKEGMILQVVNL